MNRPDLIVLILYKGDCIEKMKLLKDNSIDLVLCDCLMEVQNVSGILLYRWINCGNIIMFINNKKNPSGVIVLFGQQPFTSMLVSSNYEWFKYNLNMEKIKQLSIY